MFYDTGKVGKPSLKAAELELACCVARPWVKTSPLGLESPSRRLNLLSACMLVVAFQSDLGYDHLQRKAEMWRVGYH